MTERQVSIGFMFHRNDMALRKALEGMASLTYPRNLIQLILLDNSDDGATETVRGWVEANPGFGEVIFLREFGNRPQLRNRIIARAGGEYLLFVDSDVEIPQDTVQRLISHFGDPSVFMASIPGELVSPPPLLYPEKYREDYGDVVYGADYAWFGCTMLRLSHLAEVGYLDEGWVVQNEDGAYVQRAIALGLKLVVDRRVLCKHHRRYSAWDVLKKGLTTQMEPIELQMRYGWNVRWVRRFLFWNLYFLSIPLIFLLSPIPFLLLNLVVLALNVVKMRGLGRLLALPGGVVNSFFMLIGSYYGFLKILQGKLRRV